MQTGPQLCRMSAVEMRVLIAVGWGSGWDPEIWNGDTWEEPDESGVSMTCPRKLQCLLWDSCSVTHSWFSVKPPAPSLCPSGPEWTGVLAALDVKYKEWLLRSCSIIQKNCLIFPIYIDWNMGNVSGNDC